MNNISIRLKLIITYFIVVIIPICIIGYFLTNKLYSISFNNITSISNANLNQLKGNYINKLESYKSVLDGLVNYAPLIRFVETEYKTDYEAIDDFNVKVRPFIRRLNVDEGDMQIRIYSNNSTIWHSVETSNKLEELKEQAWYSGIPSAAANPIRWAVKTNSVKLSLKYFGCYKTLRDLSDSSEISSVMAVFFSEKELFSLVSAEKEAGMVIFLCNNEGSIISTTERDLLFSDIQNVVFNSGDSISSLKNNSVVKYKNSEYLFQNTILNDNKIMINGWSLSCLIPAKGAFGGIKNVWITSIILCFICIILALILIVFISQNIAGRISNLIKKINGIVDNNFIVEGNISGKDEIGTLENSFIDMVHRIYTLINEVYIANLKIKDSELNYQKIQTEKRKAEIIALQGQINPHYLFNTLETIRMSLVLKDDKKNADMIEVFAQSFRLCIENKNDIHTIREELLFVENYFTIQKYRFGDNIDFIVDIPEFMLEYTIPKLILQPLIENAVYHGLEMKGEKGVIEIKAYEADGDIHIIVTDDGIGIPEEVLMKIIDELNSEEHLVKQNTRIAIRNVNNRLRLMFGEGYGLIISSKVNEGTVVEINFPVKM